MHSIENYVASNITLYWIFTILIVSPDGLSPTVSPRNVVTAQDNIILYMEEPHIPDIVIIVCRSTSPKNSCS